MIKKSLCILALCGTPSAYAEMPAMFAGLRLTYQVLDISIEDSRPLSQQTFMPQLAVGDNDDDYGFAFVLGKRFNRFRLYGAFNYADFDENDFYTLVASADYLLPIYHKISLFAGASAGISFIDVDDSTDIINLDNDVQSYAVGGQLGAIYKLDETYELEAGYRFLSTDLEFRARFPGGTDEIRATSDSVNEVYIGFNGYF